MNAFPAVRKVRVSDARRGDRLATIRGDRIIDHGPIVDIRPNCDRLDIVAADGFVLDAAIRSARLFVIAR